MSSFAKSEDVYFAGDKMNQSGRCVFVGVVSN
jgi:hypothetical protein